MLSRIRWLVAGTGLGVVATVKLERMLRARLARLTPNSIAKRVGINISKLADDFTYSISQGVQVVRSANEQPLETNSQVRRDVARAKRSKRRSMSVVEIQEDDGLKSTA